MLLRSEIDRLKAAKEFARCAFAHGGYPLALITADGGAICSDCTRSHWVEISRESFDNSNCGFRIAGVSVNWENHYLSCDSCSDAIPSAYGEDSAE